MKAPRLFLAACACVHLAGAAPLSAAVGHSHGSPRGGTITDRTLHWPSADEWQRVLTLQDYNTRVVLAGTALLGLAAGVLGCFTLLRKRALMGDALSHATLPGIGLAFMFSVLAGGSGKALPTLLAGAAVTAALALGFMLAVREFTRLKEDTALGIVLSVFFGAGVAVLGVVQRMGQGHSAGLESFIYGKTAAMLASDAQLIGGAGVAVLLACALLFKEFRLLCFDSGYAQAQGWPTVLLDAALMALVILVTVIGLQAVGLILIIALLIIPAAAARFWTERMSVMLAVAGALGGVSCLFGAGMSALLPNLPSGAMIVLTASLFFLASMFFGPARGVAHRWRNRRAFEAKVRRQHLLRAIFETVRGDELGDLGTELSARRAQFYDLLPLRSWSPRALGREISWAEQDELVRETYTPVRGVALTEEGWHAAAQVVRQHRLWELYLITHADVAPSHVDRDADAIEHVLGAEMIRELETLLAAESPRIAVPRSPHLLTAP